MLTHREFSAWIVCEGKPLREYLMAVDSNASKVSCWMPSEAGKNFSVHWRDTGSRTHSCSYISLDGFQVPGRFLTGCGETSREGVRTGSHVERPFVFREQTDTPSGDPTSLDAGTITLRIRRVRIDGARDANKLQELPEPRGLQSDVTTHCIGYGDARRTYEQYPQTWQVKPYDGSGKRPYVTFVFRYRSREFLLTQGIIPVEDALQIPRGACAMNRKVTNAPPCGQLDVDDAKSNSQSTCERELGTDFVDRGQGSALQNAFNVPIRSATNVRMVNTNPVGRHGRYPGEGVIDFGTGLGPNLSRMSREHGAGSRRITSDDGNFQEHAHEDPRE